MIHGGTRQTGKTAKQMQKATHYQRRKGLSNASDKMNCDHELRLAKDKLKRLEDGIATERKYLMAMSDSELLAHIRASLASDTLIQPPHDSNIKLQ